MDSTSIAVGHKQRITRNKVFKGGAKRGKTPSG
ncbi:MULTISPECIES: transposase [unclassified Neochlamydia]